MDHLFATVAFGLAASLCWGSGDFSGGLASRRANVTTVVVAAYTVGFFLLVGLAAPVSAMLTATLPVAFSAFITGLPSPLQLGGFALALLAIGLISRPDGTEGSLRGIGLALIAGLGFGCFFILISRVSPGATFWPLATARLTSVALLLIVIPLRRQPILPGRNVAPLVVATGVLDAVGNAFFVAAAHSGRRDVAAILSSLYPAATVILAAIFLRERVQRIQGVGIVLALLAIPLISA